MLEVLYITAHNLTRGGVERCLESWIKHFPNREKLHMTWYCPGVVNNEQYLEELKGYGVDFVFGNIPDMQKHKNPQFTQDIEALLQKHRYDVIHVNTGVPLAMFKALECVKKQKTAAVFAHSHSYVKTDRLILKAYLAWLGLNIDRWSDVRLACSDTAGRSLFGYGYRVLKNAIEIERFGFSPDRRATVRQAFGISDQPLIGYIGTLTEVKNPLFAVEAFAAYSRMEPQAVMMMLGKGPMEARIRTRIKELGVEDKVRLLGERSDVPEMMQAMDVLLFPSHTEGLGLVAVEAQTTGLPVLASEGVPQETKLTSLIEYLPTAEPQPWADRMAAAMAQRDARRSYQAEVKAAGYDIGQVAAELMDMYKAQQK